MIKNEIANIILYALLPMEEKMSNVLPNRTGNPDAKTMVSNGAAAK